MPPLARPGRKKMTSPHEDDLSKQEQLPPQNLPDLKGQISQQSEDLRIQILHEITAKLTAEFLGPFPSPDTLARFEQIVPGSAAQIINMAESQVTHRQYLERTVVEGEF